MNGFRHGLSGACLLLLFWTAGCAAPRVCRPGTIATGEVVLNTGVPVETEHNVVIRTSKLVKGAGPRGEPRHYRYSVLLGPNPPPPRSKPPPPGTSWGIGRGWITNSAPTWHVDVGYTYAMGWWPVIATKRVRALTEGTTLIVQVLSDEDRLFLIDPKPDTRVRVELRSDPTEFRVLTYDENARYIEARDTLGGVELGDPTAIPNDEETQAFLKHVLGAAATAGL